MGYTLPITTALDQVLRAVCFGAGMFLGSMGLIPAIGMSVMQSVSPTRIYLVTNALIEAPREAGMARDYLVPASSKNQAIGHVVRQHIQADVASQDDLIRLIHLGIHVEDANGPGTAELAA